LTLTFASTNAARRPEAEALRPWFQSLDERGLPASWAVVGRATPRPFARQLVQSAVPHELAYWTTPGAIGHELAELQQHAALAQRAALSLRSLVSLGGGIHPAVTARLGVQAIVRLDAPEHSFQTVVPRSHGWNQWDVPVTDRVALDMGLTEATQVLARIYVAKRDGVSLHLLWALATLDRPPRSPALRLLDALADLARRNHIEVLTLSQVADRHSVEVAPRAA